MNKIKKVFANEILDSRGNPTLNVTVTLTNNIKGSFSVPSGASTGIYEAYELRDNDKTRFNGKGVLKAKENVNTIINDNLVGMDVFKQEEIDELLIKLDGTYNKNNLGANAILGVSIACAKAAANAKNLSLHNYLNNNNKYSLVTPMMNVINGGVHALNNLDIQEFMIVPKKDTFKETLRCATEVFHSLKQLLEKEGHITSVGEEGGFTPVLKNNKNALNYIIKSIENAGYIPGKDIFLALDISATSLYNENKKTYKIEDKFLTNQELLDYYLELLGEYPIISIEDPFAEEDEEGFKLITEKLGTGLNIAGDIIFSTNKNELKNGIDKRICNSILIKPNQIGTFLETLETIILAKQNKYTCIMSNGSYETTDTFIVDAAVALNIPFIKIGSLCRGERICKYNRLLKIEEEINKE
jgi:enolase